MFNHSSSFIRCKLIEEAAYTWVFTLSHSSGGSDAGPVGCRFNLT